MRTSLHIRFLPFLFCVIVLSGCKKNDDQEEHDDHHGTATVDLRLAFQFNYGTHNYELASEYTDALDHVYKLDRIRFLLSGLEVIDVGSNVLASYPGVQFLVDASQPANDFALGSLTAEHAHQIRFTLGLNADLNQADPDTCAAPLSDTTMHWGMGASEGFWFMVLEGRVDSDNSGAIDGADATFSYKCGTQALTRSGWAIMHADLLDGSTYVVQAPVDIERLMSGIDVLNNLSALGDTPLNVQLMDSLRSVFNEGH